MEQIGELTWEEYREQVFGLIDRWGLRVGSMSATEAEGLIVRGYRTVRFVDETAAEIERAQLTYPKNDFQVI